MKLLEISLADAIGVIALPVSAAPAPSGQKTDKAPAAEQKKYCLQYEDTIGSRVRKTECKTKAQWAREGVDIDAQSESRS